MSADPEDFQSENLAHLLASEIAREVILEEVRGGEVISIKAKRCRCGRFSRCEPCAMFDGLGVSEWDRALREIDGA